MHHMQVRTSILISEDVLVETRVLAARLRLTASALIENLLREKIASTGVSIYPRQKRRKGPTPMSEEEKHRAADARRAGGVDRNPEKSAPLIEKRRNGPPVPSEMIFPDRETDNAELNGILEGLDQAQKGQSKPIEEIRERLKGSDE